MLSDRRDLFQTLTDVMKWLNVIKCDISPSDVAEFTTQAVFYWEATQTTLLSQESTM